jgi:hypothetical protein
MSKVEKNMHLCNSPKGVFNPFQLSRFSFCKTFQPIIPSYNMHDLWKQFYTCLPVFIWRCHNLARMKENLLPAIRRGKPQMIFALRKASSLLCAPSFL